MGEPTVSVLIPCYNAGKYIGETLESVFRQTWTSLEVIIIDDGSTDDSAEIVERFSRPSLRLLRQPNRGQTAALNLGLRHASGDFVQFLDADDLISQDKIALQLDRLRRHPSAVASAEWGRFYRDPSETVFDPEPVWKDLDPIDWLALSRADGLGMMFPALWLVPMSIVKYAGPWNEPLTLAHDGEYFTRIVLAAERVLFCPGARCYYRSGVPGSISGRRTPAAWASQFRVIELCEGYLRAREDSPRVRRAFALSWQHLAHASYPYDAALARVALQRAAALDPVKIQPDGGPAFKAVARVLGWRFARKLQVASGRV